MKLKIILFEDDPKYSQQLPEELTKHLRGKGEVKLFKVLKAGNGDGLYEDRLMREMERADYKEPALIVADRDLSRTEGYEGMSESEVKRIADRLSIPECAYARGVRAQDFMSVAERREARIVLSLEKGNDVFAQQVVSIAEGFAFIAKRLPSVHKTAGVNSLGKLLASILGKPEYADKMDLYASGDQNRLASVLQVRDSRKEKLKHLMCLLGYWLWDSILRYPGVVVNEVATSSYLNIQETVFKRDEVQAIFAEAQYKGPFADAKGPMWWRGMLDDMVAKGGVKDGREFAKKRLRKDIPRSKCCVDATKPAGYYCMLSKKPVSLENSKGGLAWFPRGADLARVSNTKYDELAAWL